MDMGSHAASSRRAARRCYLNQGTIYASLVRLQQRGWISAEWGVSDNNRKARFYAITRQGRKQLARGHRLLAKVDRSHGPDARIAIEGSRKMIDSFRRGWNRVLAVFRRDRLDADLEAEIASHIEAAIEENLRRGMTPEEARAAGARSFRHCGAAKEQQQEARGLPALDVLRQDLRYTFRTLRRDRALACIVILVLALGIGANVAVFSVVNTILLRPLPFREPGPPRLVRHQRRQGRPLRPDLHGCRIRGVPAPQPVIPGRDELSDLLQFHPIQADRAGRSAAHRRGAGRRELLSDAGRRARRWDGSSLRMSAEKAAVPRRC